MAKREPSGWTEWDVLDGIDELAAWLEDYAPPKKGKKNDLFKADLAEIRKRAKSLSAMVDRKNPLPLRDKPRKDPIGAPLRAKIAFGAKVIDAC